MIEYGNIQQKTAIHDLRVDFLIWFKELYYIVSQQEMGEEEGVDIMRVAYMQRELV